MKNLAYKSALTLAALLATFTLLAQPAPGAPPATPIDGGLSVLLAAGGLYDLKKLREKRK